ncbi:MAG: adenylate/guanylate cyclase domain-containing protein [Nitrospinae bacterium]|nr:adenylate/guanylate cyclase domain-containing protein [Nitrospinota bacterium]
MKKHQKILHAVLLISAVFLLTASLYLEGLFVKPEGIFHDAATRLERLGKPVSSKVAVVLIDEASLRALNPIAGRWPWPRAIYSDLLEFLAMGKPRAVVFDVLFTERTNATAKMDANDAQLAAATEKFGSVYHAMHVLRDEEDETNRQILNQPMPPDFVDRFAVKINGAFATGGAPSNSFYIPFKELYRAAKGVAVVEFSPDADGIYRSTRPLREYQGKFFPVPGLAPFMTGGAVEASPHAMKMGGKTIPLDDDGKYTINVYGKFSEYSISGLFASLQMIRAGEVEKLMVSPSEFKDKVVYVGGSAVGVEDLKSTSISSRTPGVFLHASLASNFIEDDFLFPPNRKHTLVATFAAALLCLSGIFGLRQFWQKVAVPLVVMTLWAAYCVHGLFVNAVYEFVPPLSSALFAGIAGFGYVALTEGREKGKVRRMFSQYVSPEVLKVMTENPEQFASIGAGSKAEISVLFSDIRNFTTFSERSTPEQVVDMLNAHFSHMTEPIIRRHGTVDKFIGDAIMAFWGAPVKLENHAESAVMAALEMKRQMALVNEEIKKKGIDFTVKIGIGVNSGDAIIGNIGSEKKLNYTVIGDTVNLASRLETITKTYDVLIIISETTRAKLRDDVPCRVLDTVRVKGKEIPVRIFEPMDCHDEESRRKSAEVAALTNAAFAKYEIGDYKEALELYNRLEECPLRELYVKRCENALATGKQPGVRLERRKRTLIQPEETP